MEIQDLPPREREVVDALLVLGPATARSIRDQLDDPPTDSAVRSMLRRLEEKGVLRHSEEGASYLYRLAVPKADIQRTALQRLVRTLFGGSPTRTVAALLDSDLFDITEEDVARIEEMTARAREGTE